MAVQDWSFLPCSWNLCIPYSFKVRLDLEATVLIVHKSDIVNMKSDERWRRFPAINLKFNAPARHSAAGPQMKHVIPAICWHNAPFEKLHQTLICIFPSMETGGVT